MTTKVIAMYLPQFHRVRENDEWWGDGFTEWTSVKSAERLFDGHEQPQVPLGQRYYDLMNPDVMRWQAELMHHYGVDGMCFYHYWFKDGRRILERPAELLLHTVEIDMPFCFSWANESWVRSWSRLQKMGGNPWAARFDSARTEGDDGVLLEQEYGGEDAWRAHYVYLSPFFHDPRYLLHGNMPLFLIYKPDDIPCLRDMLACWDKLARAEGFDGVYVIGTNTEDPAAKGLKGVTLQEPQDTIVRYYQEQKYENPDHVMLSLDYGEMWQRILGKPVPQGASLGGFSGYDDTPRRGHGGTVIRHRSPEIFGRSMRALLAKAERHGSPYLFLNAWNEWGEGMYLEPDEQYGTAFLEALRDARNARADENDVGEAAKGDDVIAGQVASLQAEKRTLQKTCDRYRGYWQTLDLWLRFCERGGRLSDWLRRQGVADLAVYGMGMLGGHLLYQLGREQFPVCYAIDRQRKSLMEGLQVYLPEGDLPPADAVLVTVLYDFQKIRAMLLEKGFPRVWSLEDVLQAAVDGEDFGG